MKITPLTHRQAVPIKKKSVLDIDLFRSLDKAWSLTTCFHGINTTYFRTRPKKYWNSKGREIYSHSRAVRLAKILSRCFSSFKCIDWYAEMQKSAPFPDYVRKIRKAPPGFQKSFRKLAAEENFKIESFKTPLLITDPSFLLLECLIELPFVLNTPDIHLFSLQAPLCIHMSHHLDFSIIAEELSTLRRIKRILTSHEVQFTSWSKSKSK